MAEINSTVNRARIAGMPSVGFPWRLLIISVVVFGLTVLIWAGISFGYIPYLNSQISGADAAFNTLSSKIDLNQQQNLTDFYSQLYNIQTLSQTHIYPSKLFDFLEKNVYPTVKIVNMQAGVTGGNLSIDGLAADYGTLVNELAVLKSDPNVLTVSLSSSSQRDAKSGGGVTFSIKLTFNPSYLETQ